MYLLIGKNNCSRCDIIKTILINKQIKFEYKLLEELLEEDRKKYILLAKENNQLEMPLIIKDNKLVKIQEV